MLSLDVLDGKYAIISESRSGVSAPSGMATPDRGRRALSSIVHPARKFNRYCLTESEETMLNRREEAVLLFLNDLGHKYNGRVIPSMRSIAAATNYSLRSVKYAVEKLRATGVIQTRKRNTKRGMRASNQYFLTPVGEALMKELAIRGAKTKELAIRGAKIAREVYKRDGFFEASQPIKTMAESEATELKSCPFGQDCKDAVNALAHSDESTCTVCFQTLTREKLYPLVGIGEDGPATPDEYAAEVYMRESKRRRLARALQNIRDLDKE